MNAIAPGPMGAILATLLLLAGCDTKGRPPKTASPPATQSVAAAVMEEQPDSAASIPPAEALLTCEGLDEPSSEEVFAALVAIDYYVELQRRMPNDRFPVQDRDAALRVLVCDRKNFGWDARVSWARTRLGTLAPQNMSAEFKRTFEQTTESIGCCATLSDCNLAESQESSMEGAVKFRLSAIPGSYSDIAKILDPQSWTGVSGSWFQRAERQSVDQCSTTKPPDVATPNLGLGETWCDVIYEKFEYQPDSDSGLLFENSLFFDTQIDPVDPADASKTKRRYDLNYGICPGASFSGRWRGGAAVSGAILRDSGCSSAADTNDTDEGQSDQTDVDAVKRLHLDLALCGSSGCDDDDAIFLDSVLRVLVVVTRISVCNRDGVEKVSCAWLVPCDTEFGLGSKLFDCGFATGDTFECD